MAFRAVDWYDTPLYYDIIFDQHTAGEVAFVEAMYERWIGARGKRRLLEPACGSGRLVAALAERGFEVSGFDASRPMLEFAQRRLGGASASLRVGRMESFSYRRRFDLAHCFVSTFKYLTRAADARAHLERVAAALVPGGVYLLGFHLTEYEDRETDRERWHEVRDGIDVRCEVVTEPADPRARLEQVRSRLTVRRGGALVARQETSWKFRTYSAAQFRRLVARVPALELVAVHDFDYDPAVTHELGADRLDVVAVLRRRS